MITQEAEMLKQEAKFKLEQTKKELEMAQEAQEMAEQAAKYANQITLLALNKEVEGRERLVIAGHQFMQAGAVLQAEAAKIGNNIQAPISTHKTGKVRQKTIIEVPPVPRKAEIHVKQEKQTFECVPVEVLQEKIIQEAKFMPQMSF